MEDLARKFLSFRKSLNISQAKMGKMLEIPQRTWANYETGRTRPSLDVLMRLEKLGFKPFKTAFESVAENAGLSYEEASNRLDLLSNLPADTDLAAAGKIIRDFQSGEYTIFKYNKSIPLPIPTNKADAAALVLLPLYSQKASAGKGQEPTQLNTVDAYMPVVIGLLRGANPKSCGVLKVKGDSMTDIGLYDGDYAIFDTAQIEGDGVYVITVNGLTRVKRLENRVIEKKIIISSENVRRYPNPEELSYEQAAEMLTIHGKVIGWIHSHFY